MTPIEILEGLKAGSSEFPETAARAAIEQQESVTPLLLEMMEATAADPEGLSRLGNDKTLLIATYLLAQFRESRALEPLCRVLRSDERKVEGYFGRFLGEDFGRVLASLYGGNPKPIQDLIECQPASEWVRAAAIESLAMIAINQPQYRATVESCLEDLLRNRLERDPNQVWEAMGLVVGRLRLARLLPELKEAYDESLSDPFGLEFPACVMEATSPEGDPEIHDRLDCGLIDDAIRVLTTPFGPFDDPYTVWDDEGEEEDALLNLDDDPEIQSGPWTPEVPPSVANDLGQDSPTPFPTPFEGSPKIGRNDPCPCGSGKKAKKCCHP